ncbi:MAG: cytochrome c3 family protein, partial [Gemmatimonadota bacterium]
MGRVLLIALVAVVLGGCEPAPEATGEPHAELACAACHSGPRGERGRASVPASSCQASGCHEAGGPEQVQIATVTFPHRDHAEGYEIDATCAGCHTHETGEAPLEASVEACALCHVGEVTSAEAAECRLCHQQPDHSSLTSQGVAVSHSQLPWIDIGCVRCHYDVAEADTDVSLLECRECHEDVGVLNARAVGRDLHPIHDGITCTACHRDDLHEVRAMSSAVALVCSDCHREAHEVALDVADPPSAMCAACHTGVHVPQQRLLLGIQPELGAQPGAHFVAGITCRSCHIPPAAPTEEPVDAIRGQAASCAGCHRE